MAIEHLRMTALSGRVTGCRFVTVETSELSIVLDAYELMSHDKGRDCALTELVLDNYRRRALAAEAELARRSET
jgi:hypothetical protein